MLLRRWFTGAAALTAVLIGVQSATAQGAAPLTVDEAVRVGLKNNPQVAEGAAALGSAEASYRSMAAIQNPQLAVSRAQGSSSAPTINGQTSDTFVDVTEAVDTSGQRRFQAAGARAAMLASKYMLDETKLTLEQQIRDAYWSLAAALSLSKYGLDSLQEAQRVNTLIKAKQAAGDSPQIDVIRSSIDVANAQQAYITAQGNEKTALTALNVLLARPPTEQVTLEGAIEPAGSTKPEQFDLAVLTRTAIAARAMVKQASEQVHAAEYAVKQAKAARVPSLSLDYERSLQQASDSFLFNVSVPLLDFGSTHYSVKAADESRKQAVAQRLQAEQQVTQQVAQAVQDTEQAQKLLESFNTDILQPSIKLHDMAQVGYNAGATGILPVIDAETTLRTARTGYINALLAVLKAQDELNAATGSAR